MEAKTFSATESILVILLPGMGLPTRIVEPALAPDGQVNRDSVARIKQLTRVEVKICRPARAAEIGRLASQYATEIPLLLGIRGDQVG